MRPLKRHSYGVLFCAMLIASFFVGCNSSVDADATDDVKGTSIAGKGGGSTATPNPAILYISDKPLSGRSYDRAFYIKVMNADGQCQTELLNVTYGIAGGGTMRTASEITWNGNGTKVSYLDPYYKCIKTFSLGTNSKGTPVA